MFDLRTLKPTGIQYQTPRVIFLFYSLLLAQRFFYCITISYCWAMPEWNALERRDISLGRMFA